MKEDVNMSEKMLNPDFRQGYQEGYSDAVKEVIERLKAKDDIYKKDLEGVYYDLQTINQSQDAIA